jgi:hypothetical protein
MSDGDAPIDATGDATGAPTLGATSDATGAPTLGATGDATGGATGGATGDDYAGPVVVTAGEVTVCGQARLSGRVEPVDGKFHWSGRVAPDPVLAGLLRDGIRSVRVSAGDRPPCEARLDDVDPWGGVRLTGTGRPPW